MAPSLSFGEGKGSDGAESKALSRRHGGPAYDQCWTGMTIDRWIAAVAAAAGIGAVIVSLIAIRAALMGVRDQLKTAVFIAYTERYSRVMAQLPFEARSPGSGYRLDDVPEAERTVVLSAFREYFNLCSEEWWLKSNQRIDNATWQVWELGMKEVARLPCFAEAWQGLCEEYASFDQFRGFMNGMAVTGLDAGVRTDR
jgi:hypothetical protein